MSFQQQHKKGTTLLHSAEGIRVEYLDYPAGEEIKWAEKAERVIMLFNLKTHQHVLYCTGSAPGYMENRGLQACIIQLTQKTFSELVKNGNAALKNFGEKVRSGKAGTFQDKSLFIDIEMHSVIRRLVDCRYNEELKEMFYYSKIMELLAMQANSLLRSDLPKNQYIRNEYDKERILFARDYLIQHMDLPPSLSELALITGINEFKLKRGFKEVFETTVFGYLSEARLELAKNELMLKQKSASEIAFELGYSSIQHFSKAFRKKFGVSPTELK